jgi:hypothetical protein
MIEKVRLWDDSAFGVGGTRKLRLRVPSPIARLCTVQINMLSWAILRNTPSKSRPNPWSLIEINCVYYFLVHSSFSKFNALSVNQTNDDRIDYWTRLIDLRCISPTTAIFSFLAEDIELIEFTACLISRTSSFSKFNALFSNQRDDD